MKDLDIEKKNGKKKTSWAKHLFLFFALFLGITILASCTQAFVSSSDKANIVYAYLYGQDSADEKAEGNLDTVYKSALNAGYPLPNHDYELYLSANYDYGNILQAAEDEDDAWVVTAYPTPLQVTYSNNVQAFSKPQEWISQNVTASSDEELKTKAFGSSVLGTIEPASIIKASSAAEALATYKDAFQSIKAIAIFAGLDADGTIVMWKNYDAWYLEAQTDANIGIAKVPTTSYVSFFKTTANGIAQSNRAGLNTSGQGGMYGQPGKKIYIQSKTWGEAFSQYGFLEGLLVWPLGWLINAFDIGLGGAGTGWAEFLAIMFLTLIVRSIMMVISIFTSKSQNKMTELQPQIALLQAKYPNSKTNSEERMALSRETTALYKKNGVKPLLPFLTMIVQFPLFICVWAALEGSAELSSGNFFGIELTSSMSNAMLGVTTSGGAQALAIMMFVCMSIAQVLSMMLPQWFQSWKTKRFMPATTMKAQPSQNQNMMKYMSIGMAVFIVIMGIQLPAAMSMYWFFGAIMSLVQVLITELIARRSRHKKSKGGDPLSAMRRSKHHQEPIKSIRQSRG